MFLTDQLFSKTRELSRGLSTKAREFIEFSLSVPISKFEDYSSYLKAGTSQVWATFRALDIIANAILSTEFKVLSGPLDSQKPVLDPSITGFLSSPNPFDSWAEMLYMWLFHMRLTGNAYWLKDEIDLKGRPKYLWPLLPQYVKVVPSRETGIEGYDYSINGRVIRYEKEEIIHFRRPHPGNLTHGIGDMEPAEPLFNEHINRNSYSEKFFENGAVLSGVLSMTGGEPINDEIEWGRFKAEWKEQYEGHSNAGKVAILNRGWTYERLGLTHQEMQSIDKEKMGVESIFILHGVPLSITGMQSSNYATSRQDAINFRQYTVKPMLDNLAGKINQEGVYLSLWEKQLRLTYALAGLIDVEQTAKDYGPLYDRGGLTSNELRVLMGLERVEDPLLDQYMVLNTYSPIEVVGAGVSTEELDVMVGGGGDPPTPPGKPLLPEDEEEDTGILDA